MVGVKRRHMLIDTNGWRCEYATNRWYQWYQVDGPRHIYVEKILYYKTKSMRVRKQWHVISRAGRGRSQVLVGPFRSLKVAKVAYLLLPRT